jgi:hypothetical protein
MIGVAVVRSVLVLIGHVRRLSLFAFPSENEWQTNDDTSHGSFSQLLQIFVHRVDRLSKLSDRLLTRVELLLVELNTRIDVDGVLSNDERVTNSGLGFVLVLFRCCLRKVTIDVDLHRTQQTVDDVFVVVQYLDDPIDTDSTRDQLHRLFLLGAFADAFVSLPFDVCLVSHRPTSFDSSV